MTFMTFMTWCHLFLKPGPGLHSASPSRSFAGLWALALASAEMREGPPSLSLSLSQASAATSLGVCELRSRPQRYRLELLRHSQPQRERAHMLRRTSCQARANESIEQLQSTTLSRLCNDIRRCETLMHSCIHALKFA